MVSDTHGNFAQLTTQLANYEPETTAVVILGDCGLDFYLNKTDARKKKELDAKGYYIYWLRGNHEARPQDVPGYELIYDEEVQGEVYCDPRYPHLRAFKDWGFYKIDEYLCLVIGGAYSVDKYYRLARFGLTEETNIPKQTGWFANEQLTQEEMNDCLDTVKYWNWQNIEIDFILTHTCPRKYQPTDLFLGGIDQSKVDNTMEDWLDIVSRSIKWKYQLFGHYHADRIEAPYVEQYFNDISNFKEIDNRWKKYDETGELDWWLTKSPRFYDEKN